MSHLHEMLTYCIRHIFRRGFIFCEFRESGPIHKFNNMRKYLPPIRPGRMNATCVRNTSSTVHSACARQDR